MMNNAMFIVLAFILVSSECHSYPIHRVKKQSFLCSTPEDCLPQRFRSNSTTVLPSVVDCVQHQCICSKCFRVSNEGNCVLRDCHDYTDNSCQDNRKSQRTAILLSVFLSSIGAANFYIERNALAVGQLVVGITMYFIICTCPCFLVCCFCCLDQDPDKSSSESKKINVFKDKGDNAFKDIFAKATCCMLTYCVIAAICIVILLLAIIAWSIAEVLMFAINDIEDGDGCKLRPA